MEKDHLAILLEEMNGKFTLVLEGHDAIRQEMREMNENLKTEIEHNSFLINVVNDKVDRLEVKVDSIASDLSAHRADTEAHHGVYLVKEG